MPTKASIMQLIVYGLAARRADAAAPAGCAARGLLALALDRAASAGPRHASRCSEDWVPTIERQRCERAPRATRCTATGRPGRRGAIRRPSAGTMRRSSCETYGVGKRFGGIIAADDLDIELRKGTITALVGPNGAGKTTVFNLLTGFIQPDPGSVLLNGVELVGLSPDKVARRGLVRSFQDVRLIQRISLPAERDDGRAGPARGEHGRAVPPSRSGRSGREARPRQKAMDGSASSGCRTSPTSRPARCRTASRSWSPSPGCWPPRPRCCCSTSRPRASTRSGWTRCSA